MLIMVHLIFFCTVNMFYTLIYTQCINSDNLPILDFGLGFDGGQLNIISLFCLKKKPPACIDILWIHNQNLTGLRGHSPS